MALVAKSNRSAALLRDQRGQISIFFSASLVVFISIIAFVINVGLFVKAKINLQNATDAAAFAGASVQARQLTKIAYLNWEMRNIYKEWMYKYYVVGNLNVKMVEDMSGSSCSNPQGCMNFRLEPETNAISGATTTDYNNFPATCIHIANSETNICKRFAVPGLPEFGGYSIPGTEEASRSFVDTLVEGKISDCLSRSKLNSLVTTAWAYNVLTDDGTDSLFTEAPAVLLDRQGAWPRAMEVAMRIRNLEKVVNRPTFEGAICKGGGSCTDITTVETEPKLGNERIVKAFYSGWRNLGNHIDSEMKDSFRLTELPPSAPANPPPMESSSNYLIPESERYVKTYLDLKLMMVNFATFYAALIPRADAGTSGACNISKVALPVPGYPLGFYKNTDVLTYYAVKGEADFEGMFNPFSEDKITLTSFAAAKPFGGRIGPMLFKQEGTYTTTRSPSGVKFRSVPYISSLNVIGTPNIYSTNNPKEVGANEFLPGVPLPINLASQQFWVTNPTEPIGGRGTGNRVLFGIPNLVYDFINGDLDATKYTEMNDPIFDIDTKQPPSGDKAVGLFNFEQFKAFRGNIGGTVTPEMLEAQILRVRAATFYEAANYLIPTPDELNRELGVDSFGIFPGPGKTNPLIADLKTYTGFLYAPLYRSANNQQDLLYDGPNGALRVMMDFMRDQKQGLENYVYSLNAAAIQSYQSGKNNSTTAAEGAIAGYERSAKKISDIDVATVTDPTTVFPKSCDSLAGQFWFFYFGDPDLYPGEIVDKSACPEPLAVMLRKYFASSAADPNYNPIMYKFEYSYYKPNWNSAGDRKGQESIFSAYMPGPFNGIDPDGRLTPPPSFPNPNELMRRNFYSTKLITLDSVQQGGLYGQTTWGHVNEGGPLTGYPDTNVKEWANPLDASSTDGLDSVRY